MDLKPILATSLGIAIDRGIVYPLIGRYLAWRYDPGIPVARRNWCGVYGSDLNVKRCERLLWLVLLGFVVLKFVVRWTVLTGNR